MSAEKVIKRLKLLSENKGVQTLSYDEAKVLIAEIERLNNVINEIKMWKADRETELMALQPHNSYVIDGNTLRELERIQELKGSDKNGRRYN